MATPNDEFRVARQRTASLTHPGDCLTRQELAELVNTWVWEHHDNKEVLASAGYIGQIERGTIRWPGKLYREAFRAILGVPTDSKLGFINARSRRGAVKLDNVKRRQFNHNATTLGVGALALGGPPVALLGDSGPTPVPARVGATDIEQTRIAKQVFQSWDDTYGGGLARDAVMGQLRWSAGLLEATCPDRLRPELFSAVGDLANTAAFVALDAGADEEASRVFGFALVCAEQAEDWPLRGKVLQGMSEHAVRTGKPDDGLTLAEQGLVRADLLTPTGRAMLHNNRSHALAKMRRGNEALTAIGTADDHFAHATPDNDSPFMAFYTDARHALLTARPLVDLAILGHDPREATSRLTAAAAGHTEGYTRHRAICLTRLASLTMATGDPLQAAAIGHEALDIAGTLRSRRTTDNLRELARYATAHQDLDEVAHLRHRISALVCTDSPSGRV
ncbi:MAG: XRE family transcriptional regulator [Pseudonocardiaceae bacterium]